MAPRGGARDPTGAADGANAGDAESGQPFSVQADHTDATDPTTKQLVPVDGYRLRQNGTVAVTLPFSARDAQGHVTFAFPSGWPAGVYDILVTAYNVIDGVTNEAPLPSSTANIRLTVGSPPPPPPPPPAPPPPPPPPPGQGCGWAISPSTLTVPAAGGSFNGSLTAATTCAWTVYSTSAWITVGSTVKGTGPRTIPFTVTANTATAGRAGNVIVVDGATGSMATNIAIHQAAGGDAPPPPPSPPAQCADGLDNDKDGLIDLADPGCANATDNDESNPPQRSKELRGEPFMEIGVSRCGGGVPLNGNAIRMRCYRLSLKWLVTLYENTANGWRGQSSRAGIGRL